MRNEQNQNLVKKLILKKCPVNQILVVEYDPDVIKTTDSIVDVGPHAGTNGGEIIYTGSYEGLNGK